MLQPKIGVSKRGVFSSHLSVGKTYVGRQQVSGVMQLGARMIFPGGRKRTRKCLVPMYRSRVCTDPPAAASESSAHAATQLEGVFEYVVASEKCTRLPAGVRSGMQEPKAGPVLKTESDWPLRWEGHSVRVYL